MPFLSLSLFFYQPEKYLVFIQRESVIAFSIYINSKSARTIWSAMVCFATVFAAKYFLLHTLHLLAEVPTWLSPSLSLPSSLYNKEQRSHRGSIIMNINQFSG